MATAPVRSTAYLPPVHAEPMKGYPASDPGFRELRERLESIDRALVLGLVARERAQHELLRWKLSRSRPLFDRSRERSVRDQARRWAEQAGGDPGLAERVISAAIASGKRRFLEASMRRHRTATPVRASGRWTRTLRPNRGHRAGEPVRV